MQKGKHLQFDCLGCTSSVIFSIFDLEEKIPLHCANCQKKYILSDEVLIRQLRKFEALCRQIIDAEEILGNAAIGVDVADRHVKIPFKLLLTRLNSCLDLEVGGKPLSIYFRMEPVKDL